MIVVEFLFGCLLWLLLFLFLFLFVIMLVTMTLLLKQSNLIRQGEDGAAQDGLVDGPEHVAAHPRGAEHGEGQHGEEQQDDAGQQDRVFTTRKDKFMWKNIF